MGLIDAFRKDVEIENKDEVNPQTPVASELETSKEPEESTVDRSAYNCPTCGGEGLVNSTFEEGGAVRCPNCGGTGKV